MTKLKPRICMIGDINSIHMQRWVNHFKKLDVFDIVLISSSKPKIKDKNTYYYKDLLPPWLALFTIFPKASFLPIAFYFRSYLKKLKIDILHIHQLNREELLFSFSDTISIVISVWGSDVRLVKGIIQKIFKKRALNKAEIVTATSEYLANLTATKFKIKNITTIPFGVDTQKFDPSIYKKKRNKKLRIGFAKHLKSIYGADILIRAFSNVLDKFDKIELVIAGEGEEEKKLKKQVKRLKLEDKVIFVGWIPSDKLPEFFSNLDIFAMPTTIPESFGVAALEAQSLSVPVIASNVGGVSEVVKDGETGILVKPRDVLGLEKAMIKLIENEKLRVKMGKAGRRFVEDNYKWEKNAKTMEKLYKTLIN